MPELRELPENKMSLAESRHERLSLLYQISQMMQGAVDLDRLLHLILTCVTAGDVLGFNRAFLFLIDENKKVLRGKMAVGPSSWEEAHRIWSELAKRKYSLEELLALYERTQGERSKLDELCRRLSLPLRESAGIVVQTALECKPVIVNNAMSEPQVNSQLLRMLEAGSFAVVPLMARDKAIGVIVADNLYDHHSITREHLETLSLFGLQAGLAIERTRIHQQLIESEKSAAVGRLTANIAHAIRNPLVAIGGFARLIEKDLLNAEANGKRARLIVEEVEHLEKAIGQVLGFLRPLKLSLSWMNANELLENTLVFMRGSLEEKKIKVVRLFSPRIPQVEMDVHQLKDVFMNLIGNAIHSMPEGGCLTVGTEEGEGCTKVIIGDTGVGIPEELQQRIFEPFFTTKTGGTGLGLPTSKKIVEEHGGEIKVESLLGKGTTFTITLPLSQEGG